MKHYASYEEGRDKRSISSYDYSAFLKACEEAKNEGYILIKANRKIKWPFFWINKYKAKFSRSYIKVDGEVIYSRQINESIGIKLIKEA